MDDHGPRSDPTEPQGTVYNDPQQDGSSERGHYPDHVTSSGRICQSCSRTIPPDQHQCEFCADNRIHSADSIPAHAAGSKSEGAWSFGRVVLAIVPASTRYMGLALGSAAFSLASTSELVPGASLQDASVKPIVEFEAEPAKTLTDGWGDLVDIATVDSDVGQRLFKTAIDKAQWDDSQLEVHLYTEDGSAVTSQDDVEQLQTEIASAAEQFWIVPGVVKRYAAPEPVCVPDAPTRHLHCSDCHKETVHRYTGKTTQQERNGWPVWICTDCHNPRFGHDPLDRQSTSVFADFDSPQERQAQHHQKVMTAYENKYGHYPWQV